MRKERLRPSGDGKRRKHPAGLEKASRRGKASAGTGGGAPREGGGEEKEEGEKEEEKEKEEKEKEREEEEEGSESRRLRPCRLSWPQSRKNCQH